MRGRKPCGVCALLLASVGADCRPLRLAVQFGGKVPIRPEAHGQALPEALQDGWPPMVLPFVSGMPVQRAQASEDDPGEVGQWEEACHRIKETAEGDWRIHTGSREVDCEQVAGGVTHYAAAAGGAARVGCKGPFPATQAADAAACGGCKDFLWAAWPTKAWSHMDEAEPCAKSPCRAQLEAPLPLRTCAEQN